MQLLSLHTLESFKNSNSRLGIRSNIKKTPFAQFHTGVFVLKIISNNAVLLVILIATSVASLGPSRVSNEAKNYRELEFLGLSRYFSVIIE